MTQSVNGVTYILQQYSTGSENHTRAQYVIRQFGLNVTPPPIPGKYWFWKPHKCTVCDYMHLPMIEMLDC